MHPGLKAHLQAQGKMTISATHTHIWAVDMHNSPFLHFSWICSKDPPSQGSVLFPCLVDHFSITDTFVPIIVTLLLCSLHLLPHPCLKWKVYDHFTWVFVLGVGYSTPSSCLFLVVFYINVDVPIGQGFIIEILARPVVFLQFASDSIHSWYRGSESRVAMGSGPICILKHDILEPE